jgi:hypothetical protein
VTAECKFPAWKFATGASGPDVQAQGDDEPEIFNETFPSGRRFRAFAVACDQKLRFPDRMAREKMAWRGLK